MLDLEEVGVRVHVLRRRAADANKERAGAEHHTDDVTGGGRPCRSSDPESKGAILRARAAEPTLNFEHRSGSDEPILWVADAVAWAYGAGQRWSSLARPIVHRVIEQTP